MRLRLSNRDDTMHITLSDFCKGGGKKNLNKNAVSKSDNGGSFQHSPSFILYPFIHLGSTDCQNLGYPAPLDQNRLMDKLRMLTPHIRLYKPASQSTNSSGDSHPYQILATTVDGLFFRCYCHFLPAFDIYSQRWCLASFCIFGLSV